MNGASLLLGALRLIALRSPAMRKPGAYTPCTPVRRMRLTLRAALEGVLRRGGGIVGEPKE